ncbi:MAG TPA: S8 family serine peptidase [Acidobacteriota bacterium]|nr:S8 family serine peptidase [Acidobacteriota bacterium]
MRKQLLVIAFVLLSTIGVSSVSGAPPSQRGDTYIVVLKEPSVVEKVIELTRGESRSVRRQMLFSPAAIDYQRSLETSQLRTLRAFTSIGDRPGRLAVQGASSPEPPVTVLARQSFLLNMMVVRCTEAGLSELRRHPDVKVIYQSRKRQLHMDSVPLVVGAMAVWDLLGGIEAAGKDIKIGIIDSGLDHTHPMLSDSNLTPPSGFPKPEEFSAYTNGKIIVARNYVTPEFGYEEQEVQTPEDEMGHGTAVASVAAGAFVSTFYLPMQGMAPKAFLGNYKVFGDPDTDNRFSRSEAVIAAIADAVADQMDVINLSLGGLAAPNEDDIEQLAVELATEVGVVVVASAGNEGPRAGTVSSPGNSPAAITVGATTPARTLDYVLEITSTQATVPSELAQVEYEPAEGSSHTITTEIGPLPIASIKPFDPTAECCSALPSGSLTGKIALIRRGNCTFREKAANAVAAGAVGIVVYQNVDEPLVIMSDVDSPPQVAVMIEKSKGEILEDFLALYSANIVIYPQTQLFPYPAAKDQLTRFSSRGPDIFSLEIKPDLVAPGQTILAANSDLGNAPVSGTSFAAPIVSGAAALIQQLHLNKWSPAAVKSSLVNTADKSTTWEGEPASVIHTGNGRLNVTRAAEASAMLAPVSVSFGTIDQASQQGIEREIEVTNLGTSRQTFAIELVEVTPHPSVKLSLSPVALTLDSGEKGKVILKALTTASLQYGVFEGFIRLTPSESSAVLTASYWGGVSVPASSTVLSVKRDGTAQFSSLPDAFSEARPGSTIEIRDSSVYPGGITLNVNQDGIPLTGLTLRAGKGSSPSILADSEGVGLLLNGVKDVTIDGIKFRGGAYGFLSLWSSGRVRNAELVNNQHGMWFENSQIRVLDSTIQQTEMGLVALSSRVNLAGMTVSNNSAQGIYLQDTPALIQKATVAQNQAQGMIATYWLSTPKESALGLFDSIFQRNSATAEIPGGIAVDVSSLFKGNLIKDTAGSNGDGIYAPGDLPAVFWIQDNQLTDNTGHGLYTTNGTQVHFVRNRVTNNGKFGLYLKSSAGSVSSSWFLGNTTGIRSEDSDLDVSNSVIAQSTSFSSGYGIFAKEGQISIRNSTITQNRRGVQLDSVPTHLVANSILDQNSQGDLHGAELGGVHSNLISDGMFAGSNGNERWDPRFTNALAGDYSLRDRNSPAVDMADPDYPSGPVDALGMERSVDGDNDGQPKPDIGALEYGSTSWVPLVLPVLSSSPQDFVGIAMVNTAQEPARVTLKGYSNGGSLVAGPYEVDVASGTQFSKLLTEVLPGLKQGWVQITTNKPDLMSFTMLGREGLIYMDGTDLSGAISPRLLLPEMKSDKTTDTQLYIVNPNPQSVRVDIMLHRPTGTTPLRSETIAARGAYNPKLSGYGGSVSGGYVTVEVREQLPVFAMEIFGTGASKAGLLALDMTRPQSALFAAQLASTQTVDTILNVINVGATAVDLTLEAYDESGSLVKTVKEPRLAAGQQYRKAASEIFSFGRDVIGWARIKATDGELVGCLRFSDTAGTFMASLPLQSRPAREFVFGHIAQTGETFTGVTLLNAGDDYAQVSLEVLDHTGVSKGISLFELKPGEKRARTIPEYLPELGEQGGGFVRVRSNSPIYGFELFGHSTLRFMSAVPQQVVVY